MIYKPKWERAVKEHREQKVININSDVVSFNSTFIILLVQLKQIAKIFENFIDKLNI